MHINTASIQHNHRKSRKDKKTKTTHTRTHIRTYIHTYIHTHTYIYISNHRSTKETTRISEPRVSTLATSFLGQFVLALAITMKLPHAVVSIHAAITSAFIDCGAYIARIHKDNSRHRCTQKLADFASYLRVGKLQSCD